MPEIPLGANARRRRSTFTPEVKVVNFLAEKSETNRFNGVDHIQRPGMVLFSTVGVGPIRGVFRQAGTFNGDFLTASGERWYRVNAGGTALFMGDLPGTERTTTAATATRALTVSDGVAYRTDGTTVTPIVMPDDRPVSAVAQLGGYFLLTDASPGSARIYYIEPGADNPDGLGFFSTESVPGLNLTIIRVGDELWVFKEEATEVYILSGDADLPFQRVPARDYDKGCRNRDTVTRADNSVCWVGNDGLVYRADNSPVRISDHAIEEQIRRSTAESMRAWSFAYDGHTLLCLTMTTGTWVFDFSTQMWSEFRSHGRPVWRAHVGDSSDTDVIAGDNELGELYRLDAQACTDNGEPIERVLTGGVGIVGNMVRCDSFDLYATTGTGTDPNLYPKARIRWSDDLITFGDWYDVSIGRQGRYGKPVRLNRLGAMRYPGRLFEVTITDDCVCTISGAAYNEASR